MDCLELNLHQLILSELAKNVGHSVQAGDPGAESGVELLAAKVETRDIPSDADANTDEQPRVFMSASMVHANIAFGELAPSLAEKDVENAVVMLLGILADVAYIDFDPCLSWTDWALPDQLVYSTVSALLILADSHDQYREPIMQAFARFAAQVVDHLRTAQPVQVLTQYAPAFHGFYRAIISNPFPWTLPEWQSSHPALNSLMEVEVVSKLNSLVLDSHTQAQEQQDDELLEHVAIFSARYAEHGRPLSGYFMVCCVIEIQWTVLAQVLVPPAEQVDATTEQREAVAANNAWLSLMRKPGRVLQLDDPPNVADALKATITSANNCFTDLMLQLEELDEPPEESYAWDTMSESLKLASLCSVVLQDLDASLFSRLKLLLSDNSPVWENLVQESALKAVTVLAHNFPAIAPTMISQLRRFVTSPLPIFEIEFVSEMRAPPPLVAAARCMALCVKLAPGDDLIMSNMYSLLNYIAATSKEIADGSSSLLVGQSPYMHPGENMSTLNSADSGLKGKNEDQKRLIGITTISVVSQLALEFQDEEVIKLTISMLLQRIRSAEATVEAAIAYNLVDLALAAPASSFSDITRAFSSISRVANADDTRLSNNMVVASQTRLAQELKRRPDLYDGYLTELLSLFAEKGIAVQTLATSEKRALVPDLLEHLSALLLPIDALLSHDDFQPHVGASADLVALFRNMWFLCVLFHFTALSAPGEALTNWRRAALSRIATKTPPIVLEDVQDYASSALDFNSVIRHDYALGTIGKHRELLLRYMPIRSHEIRHLNPAQVIFLLTLHDLETLRSIEGLPSSLVSYFVNEGLNKPGELSTCMDSIAEEVIRRCITELGNRVVEHGIPPSIAAELRRLLVASCHRIAKARDVASKYLHRLINTFPSLLCDPALVFAILEVLTLLRRACEGQATDEYNPVYEFYSSRADIRLQLVDSYAIRDEILTQLYRNVQMWFRLALSRAPVEFQSTLQKYLSSHDTIAFADSIELGASIALTFAGMLAPSEKKIAQAEGSLSWTPDRARVLTSQLACKEHFIGEAGGIRLANRRRADELQKEPPEAAPPVELNALKTRLSKALTDIRNKESGLSVSDLKRLLFRCASALIPMTGRDFELQHYAVALPFEVFTPSSISVGIEIWAWLVEERPDLEMSLTLEISRAWMDTIDSKRGIFSTQLNFEDPFYHPVEYSPTDKTVIDHAIMTARRLLTPHIMIQQMLLSRFQAVRYQKPALIRLLLGLILKSGKAFRSMSTHPLAREARLSFLLFGFESLKSARMDAVSEAIFRESLYHCALGWFSVAPQWSFGSNKVQLDADVKLLVEFLDAVQHDVPKDAFNVSSLDSAAPSAMNANLKALKQLLALLLENEIIRLNVWVNPTHDAKRGTDHLNTLERSYSETTWLQLVRTAWTIDPAIAIHMATRFKSRIVSMEVTRLVRSHTKEALGIPEAVKFLVGERLDHTLSRDLRYLPLCAPVPPVIAINFFEPRFLNNPLTLQYAYRVLALHPVELTFFFVPQIVQALRTDNDGYVERFILDTAKISQLFCHQIIWNMKANCYKDDGGEVEDPMKPTLERIVAQIVASMTPEARDFYDREFGFFNEVTSISGKLKPYIKKTKPEKKAKIDEEMAKIRVEVGVYLPSNPDGVVVDIDKKSGRPLQSHAKAPFMATFKVRKERIILDTDPDSLLDAEGSEERKETYEVWQQAIFKVGDDCRQDVLALQVIAMFKNIFTSVGLTLYLFPYRVTATAPGCGVIDVVPNATSRDEMGRSKVNDLLGFFAAKYGGQDTVAFQRARLNFIQSMAAYSVACYILQIKDRHNGNIMIDGDGHIVHIDFGFLFDIGPGGVKFEPNSFKLTHEMILLMGGRQSQGYNTFVQMTVKAFLALRPYADEIVDAVQLMLGTGLPSFKGEGTIKRLRDRFALNCTERQAADWMMAIVKDANENMRTTVYDEFQRLQNGIPYA